MVTGFAVAKQVHTLEILVGLLEHAVAQAGRLVETVFELVV